MNPLHGVERTLGLTLISAPPGLIRIHYMELKEAVPVVVEDLVGDSVNPLHGVESSTV